jgi:hypothetical protein
MPTEPEPHRALITIHSTIWNEHRAWFERPVDTGYWIMVRVESRHNVGINRDETTQWSDWTPVQPTSMLDRYIRQQAQFRPMENPRVDEWPVIIRHALWRYTTDLQLNTQPTNGSYTIEDLSRWTVAS